MAHDGSVSRYIKELKEGSAQAEDALFGQYLTELTNLAIANMKHLFGERSAALDPEIAAQSALRSMLQRIKGGKEEQLSDRNQLLGFLVSKLRHKIIDQWRTESAKKRSEGLVKADSEVIAQARSPRPSPEDAVRLQELLIHAMSILPNDDVRHIAILELEGYTDTEIGTLTGRSIRGVQLKLRLIRAIWQEELNRDAYSSPA